MDNLLEYIIPVIFAAIYFFGNLLSKNGDEGEAAPGAPRRSSESDPEAAERQRRIQEEIRRKILERRQSEQGGAGTFEQSPAPNMRQADSVEAAQREAAKQRSRREAAARRSQPEPYRPEFEPERPQANPYQDEMQARLQQIEATKRQAETLKKQAQASREKLSPQPERPSGSTYRARGPIRSRLKDPAAARAAFIYGEVLGPPVSQKKSQSVPGLA